MSFPVYFKNVNKRENSNDRFSIVGMTPVNCVLKGGTSLTHPILEIQVSNTTDVVTYSQFNEVYIQSFDRYYFIRDWQMKGRKMLCYCEVDVLASFWNDIKDQSFYITRSTQAYNPDLPDASYPAAGGYYGNASTLTNPLAPAPASQGCFVVGIINNQGGVGGVDYYFMSYLVFNTFCQRLFNISNFGTFTDITDDVAKVIINPFQYITSCFWLPIDTNYLNLTLQIVTSTTSVKMGYWNLSLGVTAYTLNTSELMPSFTIVTSLTVQKHPMASTLGNYLNLAPYSKYYLYYYPFGMIDIDPHELYNTTTIYALTTVDIRSGLGILRLSTGYTGTNASNYNTGNPFKVVTAQVGVEIGVASLKYYTPSGKSDIVANVAVGLESYGGIPGLFDRIGNTVAQGLMNYAEERGIANDFIDSLQLSETGNMISGKDLSNIASSAVTARNTAECLGMTSAISFLNNQTMCFIRKYLVTTAINDANAGRPCCASLALTTFTAAGFVLCSNAHPKVSRATLTEKRLLTNMLNSGFYVTGT